MNLPPQKKWQKKNRLSINPFSSLDYISRPFQPLPGVFLWANNKGAFPVPPGKTPINNLMKDRTSLNFEIGSYRSPGEGSQRKGIPSFSQFYYPALYDGSTPLRANGGDPATPDGPLQVFQKIIRIFQTHRQA